MKLNFEEGRRKKEKGRRKKEEGRRKKGKLLMGSTPKTILSTPIDPGVLNLQKKR
ncbi:MAG: hypothetical protein F6K48_21025 [Okeania sp. SIO3H1]|uniref:hypothetical protein n=1 Tax=Okeania sp. SIO1I7 TaxID=2607772 RepID=UPI0013C700D7|nr:hypothetical protein [Okeania sp. SIO1I7]NEN91253.1 hypothetical protein [Okeania sp. SIO3H1]NET29019.1 hypothetical protein [Okeania sp. SIO1I7]